MSSNSSLPNGFPQPPSGAGAPEGILTRPVLRASPGARLLLVRDDGAPATVRVRPCFPWSEPHRHFSLRDGEDRELALVEDPAALDPASRQALEDALAQAGFVFRVKRVVDIEEEIEIRHWTVDTEQGSRRFQTHLDDWPRELPGGGLLVRDVAGDLYYLGETLALDRRSRALLWAFVD